MNTLQEHQQRVVDKLKKQNAVLVYHGTGSGKTLTSLAAAEKYNMPLEVIGPASLKYNFNKEKSKHNIKTPVSTYTYNKPPSSVDKNTMLVFDEAHKMNNLETQRSHLSDKLHGGKNLFLSATPIKNAPSDIVATARGLGINFPRDKKGFDKQFIENRTVNPSLWGRLWHGAKPGQVQVAKNMDVFKKAFKGKVDYYKPSQENYPHVQEKDITVTMTKKQEQAYKMSMKGRPDLYYKIKHGISPAKSESKDLNAFMTASRQISNIPGNYHLGSTIEDAPKITRAYEEIMKKYKSDPEYRGVTYSQFLSHGTNPLSSLLEKSKIPHASFTGKTTDKEKSKIINDYNHGKIKQLLISSAGGEGLDLHKTRMLQIMEPSFNDANLTQVKGRVSRFKSHSKLPEKDRNIEIQNYIAIPREHGLIFKHRNKGSDEYIKMLAKKKQDLNDQFLNVLKSVGSE